MTEHFDTTETRLQVVCKRTGEQFSCAPGDTLLRAALRNGVNFAHECNSGGCGSCKCSVLDGEVTSLWPDAPALTARDRRKGRLLGCQVVPQSDVVVDFQADPDFDPRQVARPSYRSLAIREIRQLTHDMSEFVFTGDGADQFRPGQFAMFSLPGVDGQRAYSMSNLPNDQGEWRFIIKKKPGGSASKVLFEQLSPGDDFLVDGPFGNSWFRGNTGRDVICIAGGSGLSPALSVARAAVHDPAMAGRKVTLYYGGRGSADICTPQLVKGLNGPGAAFTCRNAISDPDLAADWDGPCCFVHELVARDLGDRMAAHDFYFCGPPPMTEAVQRMLMIDHKVPFDQIFFDRFF